MEVGLSVGRASRIRVALDSRSDEPQLGSGPQLLDQPTKFHVGASCRDVNNMALEVAHVLDDQLETWRNSHGNGLLREDQSLRKVWCTPNFFSARGITRPSGAARALYLFLCRKFRGSMQADARA